MISQFRIPNVSHVADSPAMSPYGLVGVRGHYKNMPTVDIWAIDDGCGLTPVCIVEYPA